ncbi:MAG: multidrug transporter ATP-binding protein [Herbinix sp.]|jgi:putative ABC transport system ATP-binding protein|nr:multidrug transporter ATP-binding protein [Herbinix sp.]
MILKANEIKKVYNGNTLNSPTIALDHINLEVEEGSFTAIMGPSGSGKTTLLNVLSGLSEPSSGKVIIKEQDIFQMKRDDLARFRRRHLGFIFQDYNLLDGLTVMENIMLPRILENSEVPEMREKAEHLMKLLLIEEIGGKYAHQVSGGQQQRCAIARAMMNDTSIIFADEPTGNLDSKSSKSVMNAFERANKDNKATILMVTHDPYTSSYSKRVIFIKDGRIVTEIYRKDSQKEFFNQIIDNLAALEVDNSDF